MTYMILGGDEYGAGDPFGMAPPMAGDTRQVTVEQRLVQAILEQAMLDYLDGRGSILADATCWFEAARLDEGSFVWCCQHLGLDPAYVWNRRDAWKVARRQGSGHRAKRVTLSGRRAA